MTSLFKYIKLINWHKLGDSAQQNMVNNVVHSMVPNWVWLLID